MRISDWSSDVCSSDLEAREIQGQRPVQQAVLRADFEGIDEFGIECLPIFYAGQLQHRKLVEQCNEVEGGLVDTVGDSVCEPLFLGREPGARRIRSEEHTSELQSLMRISYAVFCLKKKKNMTINRKPYHYRTH